MGDHDDGGVENNYLVARGDRAGEKDGDMAAWAGGPVWEIGDLQHISMCE